MTNFIKTIGTSLASVSLGLFLMGANPYQEMKPFEIETGDKKAYFSLESDGRRVLEQNVVAGEDDYMLVIAEYDGNNNDIDIVTIRAEDHFHYISQETQPDLWQKCQDSFNQAHTYVQQEGLYITYANLFKDIQFSLFK
ncbi:MAG: hypothetical protein ABIF40_05030 [archaeon]